MTVPRAAMPAVARRIHVAPVGFEVDRVVGPILEMAGERAVLVANVRRADQATSYRSQVVEQLEAKGVATEVVRASIFDLDATTVTIADILRKHRSDSLYINVSSGSKVQAFAGYLAKLIVQTEGIHVTAYYSEPDHYPATSGEPLSIGYRASFQMPDVVLRAPKRELITALGVLEPRPRSKYDLALRLAELGLLDREKLSTDGFARDERSRVGLMMAVQARFVGPLESWGFVTCEKKGKSILVSISEPGRRAFRLFGPGTASLTPRV